MPNRTFHNYLSRGVSRKPSISASPPSWIWAPQYQAGETNGCFVLHRDFYLERPSNACVVKIAADSRYRLFLNGRWIADGPGRFFPDEPRFDTLPVKDALNSGPNTVRIEVRYFGVDTFQYIRGEPGLWFSLEDETGKGVVVSDLDWMASRQPSHLGNTPRISPQLGFEEHWDFTADPERFEAAISSRRTAAPVARSALSCVSQHREIERIVGLEEIQFIERSWTIHVREALGGFLGSANLHGFAGVFGAEFESSEEDEIEWLATGPIRAVFMDGHRLEGERTQDLLKYRVHLSTGRHWISVSVCDRYDHIPELAFGYRGGRSCVWRFSTPESPSPWIFTGPLWRPVVDSNCPITRAGGIDETLDPFVREGAEVALRVEALASCKDAESFRRSCPAAPLSVPTLHLAVADACFAVRTDRTVRVVPAPEQIPEGGLSLATKQRILLDLGEISNGFFGMELSSGGEWTLDGYFFEYLEETAEGPHIQYLQNDGNTYRAAFRVRGKAGNFPFLSSQRRGFRYAMLTVRAASKPVVLQRAYNLETLYPIAERANFSSSDPLLDEVFRMSQRTLHLCMEDTFTDCPAYEQALWVGDMRHECLMAGVTFGAYDLIQHCLEIVADSHRIMPMAACQCPSGWNVVLPAFSFLWVINVWDAWLITGNRELLLRLLPAVRETLQTGFALCRDRGLFSAPTWNFFDWAPIDQEHRTVLHNSAMLAGALKAGAWLEEAAGNAAAAKIFLQRYDNLKQALNTLWSEEKNAYPDALLESGGVSPHFSQHTSFLALLFDLFDSEEHRLALLDNCLNHPKHLTAPGSPFAMFFLLDALMKEGRGDRVLDKLQSYWGAMLDAGASTCWEMVLPEEAPFRTRSHCHGWSAGPVYLLPFLFFGIEFVEPGWKVVRLRPRSHGLDFVKATVCTPHGPLGLWLRTDADGQCHAGFHAPAGVEVLMEIPDGPRLEKSHRN